MKKNFLLLKNKEDIDIENLQNILNNNNNKYKFSELLSNDKFLFNIVLDYKNQFNSIYLSFIKLDNKILDEITKSSKKNFFFLDYKSENNYIEFKKYVRENKEKLLGKYLIILKYKIKNGELIDKENILFSGLNENIEIEKLKINLSDVIFFFIDDINIILKNLETFLICFMEKIKKNDIICENLDKKEFKENIKENKKFLDLLDLKEINLNINFKDIINNKQRKKEKEQFNKKIFEKLFKYLKIHNPVK